MTEMTVSVERMPAALRRFVLHWGDMGSQWGLNRTVAQIHALLYITERPMNAEEIAETLDVARSNVSNSLKELQGWRIVERVPVPGDRRDYFTAETDVWELAARIAAGRKQREIDPALRTLEACLAEADCDAQISDEQRKRLQELHGFTVTMDRWYAQMLRVPSQTLMKMVRMGDKIVSVLSLGKTPKPPA